MRTTHLWIKIIVPILTLVLWTGCETGLKNKTAQSDMKNAATTTTFTPTTTTTVTQKASSSNRIFSNSATPGYYIQVGYFTTKTPDSTFLNRVKATKLPYTILEKYDGKTPYYHTLIGPYTSYNQADAAKPKTQSITPNGFVVNVVRP
ncbi:MAG: SPOR domain-containing protein [Campylobacterales bacterium]|nr:SPOR domain-containing protein [Campylobacterales bacterium]